MLALFFLCSEVEHETMSNPQYFMLGATDGEDANGRLIAGGQIADAWLDAGVWPIYRTNKYRGVINVGSCVVIYVGGAKERRQSFIAWAKVAEMRKPSRDETGLSEDFLMPAPERVLVFNPISRFPEPVSIRPLIGQLSIVPKIGPKWGAGLVGGNRRLTSADFNSILSIAGSIPPTDPQLHSPRPR